MEGWRDASTVSLSLEMVGNQVSMEVKKAVEENHKGEVWFAFGVP